MSGQDAFRRIRAKPRRLVLPRRSLHSPVIIYETHQKKPHGLDPDKDHPSREQDGDGVYCQGADTSCTGSDREGSNPAVRCCRVARMRSRASPVRRVLDHAHADGLEAHRRALPCQRCSSGSQSDLPARDGADPAQADAGHAIESAGACLQSVKSMAAAGVLRSARRCASLVRPDGTASASQSTVGKASPDDAGATGSVAASPAIGNRLGTGWARWPLQPATPIRN